MFIDGLAQAREQGRLPLAVPEPDASVIETVEAFFRRVSEWELACCPQCGQCATRLLEVVASRRRSCSPAKSRHDQPTAGEQRHPAVCRHRVEMREVVARHPISLPNQQQSGLQSP